MKPWQNQSGFPPQTLPNKIAAVAIFIIVTTYATILKTSFEAALCIVKA
jgi:hypothetical protein